MFQAKKKPKALACTEKEWFIIIDNRQEGPYSIQDLKRDLRFTPDTLVWKQGFIKWLPARAVQEIAEVFEDETESQTTQKPNFNHPVGSDLGQESQATLTLRQDPYQFFLWVIVLLLIIIYTYTRFS